MFSKEENLSTSHEKPSSDALYEPEVRSVNNTWGLNSPLVVNSELGGIEELNRPKAVARPKVSCFYL